MLMVLTETIKKDIVNTQFLVKNLGEYWFVAKILVYKANNGWVTHRANHTSPVNCPDDLSSLSGQVEMRPATG